MIDAVRKTLSESDVEQEVLTILQALGCRILKNTVHIRSKNPKHHRTGQTPGVPDISCRKDSWPKGLWLGLELKKPHGGVLSSEQAELLRAGGIYVVKSAEEAMAAVKETEAGLRLVR